jgi:EAL domain-containing protein (putative c-di-GMP-specific phosphodiesterase class I)
VLAIGCSSGQGWYFGKPMEADQAAQLINHRGTPSAPATLPTRNSTRAA